ncbi:NUDIX domain-containing protein [Leucobacter denitrificans]|uniref:NUDIX hydrolase n=1 Tax=Leucobacter denitrificans TaxID=683042 RepID=A0A7G9S466_9MICO|nr:NUDIX hydrolase [Leucobacter denitrificans]QNN62641.1 NUDIX hydrolase [Leucobacter denitrificans]
MSGPNPENSDLADAPALDVRVSQSEQLVAGYVWDIRRERFTFGDGELVRDYMDHPGAVAVVALDDEDRILMFRQYRHAIAHRDWEIPAGLMDIPGEGGLLTAQRELAEEADLQADHWALLLDLFSSPGGSSEVIRVFLARGFSEVEHDFVRDGEEQELVPEWVPLDEAVAAVLDGRIANAITVSSVLAASASRASGWATLRDPHAPWVARDTVRGERSK